MSVVLVPDFCLLALTFRPVVPGGAGGAMAPRFWADQLTLSQPRGTDCAHQIILAPLDFQIFRRP